MSGGAYDYIYFKLEQECTDKMFDDEMNEMVIDFVGLLKDLEWWQSCDISEERYLETLERFKKKWFGTRDENLRQRMAGKLEAFKQELLKV